MKNAMTHCLTQGSFWLLNKALTERLGLLKAFALTDFVDKNEYFDTTDQLEEGEWFFYRREDIAKRWGVQMELQRKILKEFEEDGLISKKKIGLLNYYRVNVDKIESFIKECVDEYNEKNKTRYKKQKSQNEL